MNWVTIIIFVTRGWFRNGEKHRDWCLISIIIIYRNRHSFNVAGCIIRVRRRWSVTYTSPRGLRISEFGIEGHFRIENLTSFLVGWKTLLTIAPAGARTHDLPHTQTSYQPRSPTPYSFGHIQHHVITFMGNKPIHVAAVFVLISIWIYRLVTFARWCGLSMFCSTYYICIIGKLSNACLSQFNSGCQ